MEYFALIVLFGAIAYFSGAFKTKAQHKEIIEEKKKEVKEKFKVKIEKEVIKHKEKAYPKSPYTIGEFHILDWDGKSYVIIEDIKGDDILTSRLMDNDERTALINKGNPPDDQTELVNTNTDINEHQMIWTHEDFKESICKPDEYLIATYRTKDGDDVTGSWYNTMKGIEDEIKRMATISYKNYQWKNTKIIKETKIIQIALEENCTIKDVFNSL